MDCLRFGSVLIGRRVMLERRHVGGVFNKDGNYRSYSLEFWYLLLAILFAGISFLFNLV